MVPFNGDPKHVTRVNYFLFGSGMLHPRGFGVVDFGDRIAGSESRLVGYAVRSYFENRQRNGKIVAALQLESERHVGHGPFNKHYLWHC